MARRPFVHLAGNLSGWPLGFVPTPAFLRNLDQYSSELVNGDDGGEWSPSDPIVIGPHGTPTVTLDTAGSVLLGDVETVKGNRLDAVLDARPGLVLQGGAVPELAAPLTRTVVIPFTSWIEGRLTTYPLVIGFNLYALDPVTLGAQADPVMDVYTVADTVILSIPFQTRAQHRNATIDSVDVRVLIAGQFRTVPAQAMKVRVVRVRGNTQVALHSSAGGYDANGWYVDTAATVAAFTGNGEPRLLSYIPNQNNTAINPTTDYFMLQVRGASVFANCTWLSATVTISAIADFRQE